MITLTLEDYILEVKRLGKLQDLKIELDNKAEVGWNYAQPLPDSMVQLLATLADEENKTFNYEYIRNKMNELITNICLRDLI